MMHSIIKPTTFIFLLFSLFMINSCAEKEMMDSIANSDSLITPRSPDSILPDSVFELHNDFIFWIFDNYKDSADYYVSDPVEFMSFASRRWFEFTGDEANFMDLVLDNDTLILSNPYYFYNEGFANANLFDVDGGWSSVEFEYLYTVIDSIYDAVENIESEEAIQELINNGKNRIIAIDPENKYGLINTLTQASYSFALAYELQDLYGNDPQPILWCLVYAALADVEAVVMFYAMDSNPAEHIDAIASISVISFFQCL